ncbi:kinase-like protein [Xylariaceae sp. FL1019]|nr:kinase-like protein [Xylariaceae sp. FL1019]
MAAGPRQVSGRSSRRSSSFGIDQSDGSLYRQLRSNLIECDTSNGTHTFSKSSFLPLSVVDQMISKDVIKSKLSWKSSITSPSLSQHILERAKKVFAILSLCEEESSIETVFNEGLTDDHLPLSRSPETGSYNVLVSPLGSVFNSFTKFKKNVTVDDFLRAQWQLLAPVFRTPGEHIVLEQENPMPFSDIKKISATDMSVVYTGRLHAAHHASEVDGEMRIAIKEFPREQDFQKERGNLDMIRNLIHPNLIKHIATCQQGITCFVIFPWASGGNLFDLWRSSPKASRTWRPDLFQWSFEQMFGIVDAIRALHDKNCRHGDLKPENILHFTGSEDLKSQGNQLGNLVVADVGVSKIHHQATELRHEGTDTKATTPSYEAPEVEFNRQTPRGRRYDMWSIGCMYLEFVIWLLYGFDAIVAFRELRRPSHDPFPQKAAFYRRNEAEEPEIHPAVTEILHALGRDPRCARGTGLADLIHIIECDLLRIDLKERVEAQELRNKFEQILKKARNDADYLVKRIEPSPAIPDAFIRTY